MDKKIEGGVMSFVDINGIKRENQSGHEREDEP